MKIKYDYKNCPCPHDCEHRSSCADCIKHHHSRNQLTYCEKIAEKADAAHHTPGPRTSGKMIRLLDYGACAG